MQQLDIPSVSIARSGSSISLASDASFLSALSAEAEKRKDEGALKQAGAELSASEKMTSLLTLLENMILSTGKQRNVNKTIKDGLPVAKALVAQVLKDLKARPSVFVAGPLFTEPVSLTPSPGSGNKKREASSPPEIGKGSAQTKRPRKADGVGPGQNNKESEWTTVAKKKTKKKTVVTTTGADPTNNLTQMKTRTTQERRRTTATKPDEEKEKKKKKKKSRSDAVVLQPSNNGTTSYADILRVVRANVNPGDCGVEVRSIRPTRAGRVLLELQKPTAEARAKFTEALAKAVGERGTVRALVPKTTVEIRDLDSCSTEDEVKGALQAALQDQAGGLEGLQLTPPNRWQQRVAIVTLKQEAADKLLEAAHIKVGWVSCRVRRRTIVARCYRCLGFGHDRYSCRGPDRSKACFRCGNEGHKSGECKQPPRCFLCPEGGPGHVAGSGACKTFREALAQARLRNQNGQRPAG